MGSRYYSDKEDLTIGDVCCLIVMEVKLFDDIIRDAVKDHLLTSVSVSSLIMKPGCNSSKFFNSCELKRTDLFLYAYKRGHISFRETLSGHITSYLLGK